MLSNLKRREGFTLIELMIVVAIIGILAAIAIPNFIKFQLRSKAGEAKVNLAAIRTAEEGYFAESGTYLDWPAEPAAGYVPGLKTPFNPTLAADCPNPLPGFTLGDKGYCWIGWIPEGDVYYGYQSAGPVAADPVNGVTINQFFASAAADIDGDTATIGALGVNSWGVNVPDSTGTPMAAGAAGGQTPFPAVCTVFPGVGGTTGVVDAGSGLAVLGQVGPCESTEMGRNVF